MVLIIQILAIHLMNKVNVQLLRVKLINVLNVIYKHL